MKEKNVETYYAFNLINNELNKQPPQRECKKIYHSDDYNSSVVFNSGNELDNVAYYEEYDRLNRESTNSTNTPHGVATNEHHKAEPSTCRVGRTMSQYDSNTPVERQSTPPKNRTKFDNVSNNQIDGQSLKAPAPRGNRLNSQFKRFNKGKTKLTEQKIFDAFLTFNRITLKTDDLIQGKYLDAALIQAIISYHKPKLVVLRSGLGTGKTEFLKTKAKSFHSSLGACHRVALVNQFCERLGITNYAFLDKAVESSNVGTTVHSLKKVSRSTIFQQESNHLFFVDESESVAREFASTVLKDESGTLQAIKQQVDDSELTIFLDAQANEFTAAMIEAVGLDKRHVLVIDVDHPELAEYTVEIVAESSLINPDQPINAEGLKAECVKAAWVSTVEKHIRDNKKIIAPTLSSDAGDELEEQMRKRFPTLRIINVNSQTRASEAAKNLNADTYKNYDLIIISPTMSTGISFDKHHADYCCAYITNNRGTGNALDALQMLLRDRGVKTKTIQCFYAQASNPCTPQQQIKLQYNDLAFFRDKFYESLNDEQKSDYNKAHPELSGVLRFMSDIELVESKLKNNFLSTFEKWLTLKGATIQTYSIDEFAEDTESTKEELREQRKVEREKLIASIKKAPKLSKLEYDKHKEEHSSKVKNGETMEREEVYQHEATSIRHAMETKLAVDVDEVTPERVKQLYSEINKGLLIKLTRLELAVADKKNLQVIQHAALLGVHNPLSDEIKFLEKESTSNKWGFLYKRAGYKPLLKLVGVSFNESWFINESDIELNLDSYHKINTSKAVSLWRYIKKQPQLCYESGLLSLRDYERMTRDDDYIKEHAERIIVTAIRNAGFKLRKKKGVYIVDEVQKELIVDSLNKRLIEQSDYVTSKLATIVEYKNKVTEQVAESKAHEEAHKEELSIRQKAKTAIKAAKQRIDRLLEQAGRLDIADKFKKAMGADTDLINQGQWADADLLRVIRRFA